MADHRYLQSRWAVASLAVAALAAFGCRAFRCQEISVEQMAASRQHLLRGIDAQQRGHWDEAESLYASAVKAAPRDERARASYAEALWQRGAHDAALAEMAEAVRLSGEDPGRLVQLGEMHLARGEARRALALADRAARANRQLAAAWSLRGKALEAEQQPTEALAAYHRALSLAEGDPSVQLAIARIYRQERRPQRALATLHTLAASFPQAEVPLEVAMEESLAYRDLGRHADAARSLAAAIDRGARSPDVWCCLAEARLLAGDAAGARLAVEAALAQSPGHPASLALRQQLGGMGIAAHGNTAMRY